MRFLHTGDWHIGKALRTQPRDTEYEAVLCEILDIARREEVDAVLVAGDVFDTSTPPAEAERLVYQFFCELSGSRIPAVVIGGNHDHPRRLEAVAPILSLAGVRVRGDAVKPESGGVLRLPSRDDREIATIAVLPWVPAAHIVEFDDVLDGAQQPYQGYADRVARMLRILGAEFRVETINILLGHLFVDGALVGREGGERAIHLDKTYAVTPQALPATAQYVALGHLHRYQSVAAPAPTWYPGSLLQLDFGEAGQEKGVIIVEARPGLPADVRRVSITSGRPLRDVEGSLEELQALAPNVGDAFLRVRVHVDEPTLNLAERVRALLPNAVDIQRFRPVAPKDPATDTRLSLGPEELLRDFYRVERGGVIPDAVVKLFRQLYEEERRETDPA